jgi:hypothetical protein
MGMNVVPVQTRRDTTFTVLRLPEDNHRMLSPDIQFLRMKLWVAPAVFAFLVTSTPLATPQNATPPAGPPPATETYHEPLPVVRAEDQYRAYLAKTASERHKQIVEESDELVRLSQELQAQIDKSSMNTLPVAATKQTKEIEALAKRIRKELNLQ